MNDLGKTESCLGSFHLRTLAHGLIVGCITLPQRALEFSYYMYGKVGPGDN